MIEEVFFAPDIMVEAALPDSNAATDLSHGSGRIAIPIE
jgi:hypothetical protein